MEQAAARRLGKARCRPRTHLEGHRGARGSQFALAGRKVAGKLRAARKRIDDLDRLGDVVGKRVGLRRTQSSLGCRHLRLLRQRPPRGVDARQRTGEKRRGRAAGAGEQGCGMIHRVLFDMPGRLVGVKGLPRMHEARGAARANRVGPLVNHREHVASRGDVRHAEGAEQVHHQQRERQRGFQLVGKREQLGCARLVRKSADHGRNRVDGAPTHEVAQLVAECLQPQRLVEQLGVGAFQGKNARHSQEVGSREHEQVRCVVLQIAAVDEQLAQGMRARGDLDAEDALDGEDVGDDVVRRADAADAAGDEGDVGKAPADDHRLEQAGRLDDAHLHGLDLAIGDDDVHVAMPLDTGDMVHRNGCCAHVFPLIPVQRPG